MRAPVLGCGHIGSVIAKDLAKSNEISEVVIVDKDKRKLKECKDEKISTLCMSATNRKP